MWLARPVCCAGAAAGAGASDGDGDGALHVALLAVCALPTIFVWQVAPIVLASYFRLSPFCCLIFIFVLPAIPFWPLFVWLLPFLLFLLLMWLWLLLVNYEVLLPAVRF